MKKFFPIIAVAVAVILVGVLLLIKLRPSSCATHATVFASEQFTVPKDTNHPGFEGAFKKSIALEEKGELLNARGALREIMATYASSSGIEEVQKKLDDLNIRIMSSGLNIPNETTTREVKEGDSLSMIADEFHTTVDFIKKQNGLTKNVIRPGQRLRIWTGKFSVVVNKSQNILMLKSNDDVIKTYRVSTGKDNITPVGTFKIVNRLINPPWTHEGKVYPPESPENILGTRWLGLDAAGYGIHGTTQPESIGQQATAGCVRMLNNEVEELFVFLPMGTEVTIMD